MVSDARVADTSGSGFSEGAEPRTRGRVRSPESDMTCGVGDLAIRLVVVSSAPVSEHGQFMKAPAKCGLFWIAKCDYPRLMMNGANPTFVPALSGSACPTLT